MKENTNQSVFTLLKSYKLLVILLLLVALLSNAISLFIPKIIAKGIDEFENGHIALKYTSVLFLSAALAVFFFNYLQSVFQNYVSEIVARDLRSNLSEKISQQSFGFVQSVNPAKLLTNFTADVDSVKMFVSQAVVIIISSIFMIIGTSIMLLHVNWELGLAVLTIVPIIGISFTVVLKKVRSLFKKSREVIDVLNRIITESILGSALIRVLNSHQYESLKFIESNTKAKDLGMSILRLFCLLIPVIMFTSNLAVIVILALGGHYVVLGEMSLGEFAAFNSYLVMLIFPILMIGFMSNIIAQATASYGRISGVLSMKTPTHSGTVKEDLSGSISLEKVYHSFDEKPVLKNISFKIKPGSKTAIIGPTAAGKSVLLHLLMGLQTPKEGKIEFDEKDISHFDKKSFHSQVSIVFQDSVVFNMSVRENIAFSENITHETLETAIKTAELAEFVENLPEKMDTIISERGTSLSGGQKQRIMLARALALKPRILLLDDFTARVDRNTEDRILTNLEENYPNLTLISVTQKVESVKHFDQILLLMEGELIASGTHAELLENCPEYVQINNSQRSTQYYEL